MHEIIANITCWFSQSVVVEELKCFPHSHFNNVGPNCVPSVQTKCVSMLQDLTVSGLEIDVQDVPLATPNLVSWPIPKVSQ